MPTQGLMQEAHYVDLSEKANRETTIIKRLFSDIILQADGQFYLSLIISDKCPPQNTVSETLLQLARKGIHPGNVVIILTGCTFEDKKWVLWETLKTGVKDIYYWVDEEDFKDYIIHTLQRRQKVATILESGLVKDNLVGESFVWKDFLSRVIEAALFSQCSFLMMGQSGTGKELISRLIHTIDPRPRKKDLVLLDCTTIVPELSGSEFFGHERGSYTNAMQSREGAFALANLGTLFLDEIGELHLPLQAELLRAIQEGSYKKVGSNHWEKTSFRLVCATHRNLRKQVEDGKFRQDLFFRISDCEFEVPTLEERKPDIPLLANHFIKQFSKEKVLPEFDDTMMDFLIQRNYPGNVRELRQLIQRIALRHVQHKKITLGELPPEERPAANGTTLESDTQSFETAVKQMVLEGKNYNEIKDKAGLAAFEAAIEISNGNKQQAAARLGIDVRTVQMAMKKKRKNN